MTNIRQALGRGIRGRCPQCGEGPLFVRFLKTHDRCSACGLQYQRDYGDTWLFIIITDRIPMLFGIAALYFGFRAEHWLSNLLFFLALALPIVATIRYRVGMALALDYLSRRWFA
jgi:uncharacterized protein (DUF983 family)